MCSGLVSLAEKISGQPTIDYAMRSLVTPLMQLYDNKSVAKRNTKCIVWGEKGHQKFNAGAMVCAKRDEEKLHKAPFSVRP